MLSRRKFSACALCAAVGFAATEAQAQSTQAGPGFKRTILQKTELPDSKYVTLLVAVDIDPGTVVARHTHPGVESTPRKASSNSRSKVSRRRRSRSATAFRSRPRPRTARATATS